MLETDPGTLREGAIGVCLSEEQMFLFYSRCNTCLNSIKWISLQLATHWTPQGNKKETKWPQ